MTVIAIGGSSSLHGYALAGVEVVEAADAESVRAAWDRLPDSVELVLLSAEACSLLGSRLLESDRLWVEVPE